MRLHQYPLPDVPFRPPKDVTDPAEYLSSWLLPVIHGKDAEDAAIIRANSFLLIQRAQSWSAPSNFFDNDKNDRLFSEWRIAFYRGACGVKTKRAQTYTSAEWKGFLERPMTEAELEEMDGWKPKPNEIWELVEAVIQDGYQIQLSRSGKTGMANCSMTDRNADRKTAGYALGTADDNGALALKAMLYKHFNILQRDWLPLVGQPVKGKRG